VQLGAQGGKRAAGAGVARIMDNRIRVEPCRKRVRAYLGGELVADSAGPLLVWESPHYPTYYFHAADVVADLVPTGDVHHSPSRGDAGVHDVKVGAKTAAGAARRYSASPLAALADTVRLEWSAMDEWLEEDEPVYTHARDPHTRVDILASSRHVRIAVDGVTVAESHRPAILFETGLPPRFYLPLTDLRLDLLVPSPTETHCPYKGTATYWHLEVGGRRYDDFVWTYRRARRSQASRASTTTRSSST
jgi:uncharacterized protein (DUF427 family)